MSKHDLRNRLRNAVIEVLEPRRLLSADIKPPTVRLESAIVPSFQEGAFVENQQIVHYHAVFYQAVVQLHDNVALSGLALKYAHLRLVGPNGFDVPVTYDRGGVGVHNTPTASITYLLDAPGGTWDSADNGIYQLILPAGVIKDTSGNFAAGRTLGKFTVAIPTTGSIHGVVLNDFNANGIADGGDSGIEEVTVYLDTNDDAALNDGETSLLTGPGGSFQFPDLLPGSYRIREIVPQGFHPIEPVILNAVVFSEGYSVDAGVFLNYSNHVVIDGTDGPDQILIESDPGGLKVTINGVTHIESTEGTGKVWVRGGRGDDLVTIDADVLLSVSIDGNAGADTLNGGSGNETINGGDGNDIINGFDGNDSIDGGNGNDIINGFDGNDTINGGDGNDVIDGGGGQDSIVGGKGSDQIHGGDGNDSIRGDRADEFLSSKQADSIWGDAGNDSLFGNSAGSGTSILDGGPGNDFLDSGPGNDFPGTPFSSKATLLGGDGDDRLQSSQGGPVYLSGGAGDDHLTAYDGDTVQGGTGKDELFLDFFVEGESVRVRGVEKTHIEGAPHCFLTTAVVAWAGKTDDCRELTVLRRFRDGYMRSLPDGAAMIRDYYEHAPEVVESIVKNDKENEEWPRVYAMVQTAIGHIESGRDAEALAVYAAEYLRLKARYV